MSIPGLQRQQSGTGAVDHGAAYDDKPRSHAGLRGAVSTPARNLSSPLNSAGRGNLSRHPGGDWHQGPRQQSPAHLASVLPPNGFHLGDDGRLAGRPDAKLGQAYGTTNVGPVTRKVVGLRAHGHRAVAVGKGRNWVFGLGFSLKRQGRAEDGTGFDWGRPLPRDTALLSPIQPKARFRCQKPKDPGRPWRYRRTATSTAPTNSPAKPAGEVCWGHLPIRRDFFSTRPSPKTPTW